MSDFSEFINNKGETYTNIDIDRFPHFWSRYEDLFNLPTTIQVIGTNGKGSTGRYLSSYLHNNGFKVLHYTSPHIFCVNERFWVGDNILDSTLQNAHKKLIDLIPQIDLINLSYFEYLTIIAAYLAQKYDYFVCEAGLGGEFDATSALKTDLMLVTTIDYDHQHILGATIEQIATTKLNAMRSTTILSAQKHTIIYEIAAHIANKTGCKLILPKEQKNGFEANKALAHQALMELGFKAAIDEIPSNLPFGRFTQINDNLFVDVGHNRLAASLAAQHFASKQVVLIYNSYSDKEYVEILKILKPIIKRVVIYPVENERIIKKEELAIALERLDIAFTDRLQLNDSEIFLVFGSFSVVEAFLKNHYEK